MHITSDKMKQAVSEAFGSERERNGKLSSHSLLERRIIEELSKHQKPDQMMTLRLVMGDLFGINFHKEDVDDDLENTRLRYAGFNMYPHDIGGGALAFRYEKDLAFKHEKDINNYALVTTEEGCDIPASLHEPVRFCLYNEDGDVIHHQEFKSSFDMFEDKLINHILCC